MAQLSLLSSYLAKSMPAGLQVFLTLSRQSFKLVPFFHLHWLFISLILGHRSSFHTSLPCLVSLSLPRRGCKSHCAASHLTLSRQNIHPLQDLNSACLFYPSRPHTVFVLALLTLLWFPQTPRFLLPPLCTYCPLPKMFFLPPA